MQEYIADVLEAKAKEAEKSAQWICNHLSPSVYENNEAHVKETLAVHESLIEEIESLTRMENALVKSLHALLSDADGGSKEIGGGMGEFFSRWAEAQKDECP